MRLTLPGVRGATRPAVSAGPSARAPFRAPLSASPSRLTLPGNRPPERPSAPPPRPAFAPPAQSRGDDLPRPRGASAGVDRLQTQHAAETAARIAAEAEARRAADSRVLEQVAAALPRMLTAADRATLDRQTEAKARATADERQLAALERFNELAPQYIAAAERAGRPRVIEWGEDGRPVRSVVEEGP